MTGGGRLHALALATVAATAPPACGAQTQSGTIGVTFRGATGQHRAMSVVSSLEGSVASTNISWRPRCQAGTRLPEQTTLLEPGRGLPAKSRRILNGSSRITVALSNARLADVAVRVHGRRTGDRARPAAERWTGSFRARVVVRRLGRIVDRCRLTTRWQAAPEGFGRGTWTIRGDPDAWPAIGGAWRYDPSNASLSATGDRREIDLVLNGRDGERWTASLRGGDAGKLRQGRRYIVDARRPTGPTLFVTRGSGGCASVTARFAFEVLRFDRLYRLTRLKLTYEQRCQRERGAIRATVAWHAAP